MINMNKLKYKATDAAIVVGTIGVIGLVSYFVASTISSLNKITLNSDDETEEDWWK